LIAKGLTFLEKSKRLQVPERSRVKVGVTGGICEVSFEITHATVPQIWTSVNSKFKFNGMRAV
jgi:hypothetical protein